MWDGGKSDFPLLIQHEQGIGDIIQFCHYARWRRRVQAAT
jgi:hypothetical protein